ncbi:flavin-containing monooxygenase [Rhodococcus sp. TAF43]|uniref:flavin-containing monooxygenase n=1 Tax=Rhodococcus sp. TAF43 TaxID=3237483 RepID=UPI003F95D30A
MNTHSAPSSAAPAPEAAATGSVLIIGSGFSGLAIAAKLEDAGISDWLILEHADRVGGTWRDNTYPGCACDIPSPLYSYSFDQNPNWSHLFAPQPEILEYLETFAHRRGLTGRIRFGRRVSAAEWDERRQAWTVTTANGERYEYTHLVSAVGLLHRPKTLAIPGLENFTGTAFHSAQWNHDYDLTGKRIAVIGTGASAIQFVPAIADQVASMTIFQRSAPWIMPKADRPFDEDEKRKLRRFPFLKWYRRARLYWQHEERAEGFTNVASDNDKTVAYARRHLERQVPDPELRAKLTPDYTLGCKRLLISSDYYPALMKPHVNVVTEGIREITATSVITDTGEVIDADCIIFGTGFDAQNALAEVDIIGRTGMLLDKAWANGMNAYLGTTVNGFPNFFILCGPNTGLGHNSQVFMIERQVRYTIAAIKAARRRGPIEVTAQAQERFRAWLNAQMSHTVWNAGGCTSWYLDPRTGENTLLWPSSTVDFWKKTLRIKSSDYTFTKSRGVSR